MKNLMLLLLVLILAPGHGYSQDDKSHAHVLSLNYLQIREEMNYGLVFKGPGLGYTYSASWENDQRLINYACGINLSVPMTRDVIAPAVNVVPVRLDYLFKTGSEGKVSVGPYYIMDYNMELYPDLQSGYPFWFTHFSLGCALTGWFNLKKSRIDLALHTTFLGLTSRQPVYDDPYFYDASFGHLIRDMHQDLEFSFIGDYNMTELEARWQPESGSRLAYAYALQVYAYANEPTLNMINHTIKIIILPEKNK